ncbi:MAG: hypothetical protein VX346_15605 [Planctomycetota bacterium]|nr:hypothetical protein [Planctomycetota bacterium]
MIRKSRCPGGLLLVLLISLLASDLSVGATAVKKVADGIRHFQAGRFDEADRAFVEAEVSDPENATIWFDRACALAAAGEVEKARKFFQQAALSRDTPLEIRCHYNLGCLAARQAQTLLGEDPGSAEQAVREQSLSQLLQAVGHYRDCLRLDTDHSDARHNLELIRLYIKHIQSIWESRDREKSRQEKNLLQFLAELEQRQTVLWTTTRGLASEEDSPRRRQNVKHTATEQRKLREEIEPLQEKVEAFFQSPKPAGPTGTNPPAQDPAADPRAQAMQLLQQLANESNQAMNRAALGLESNDFQAAQQQQREVLDRLNQMFMVSAPFGNLLQRATQQQQQLVDVSTALVEPAPTDAATVAAAQDSGTGDSGTGDSGTGDVQTSATAGAAQRDYVALAQQQTRVAEWSRMLTLKAEAEIKQTAANESESESAPVIGPIDPSVPSGSGAEPSAEAAAQAEQQRAAMKEALEKAVSLGPDVERHAQAASSQLEKTDAVSALPEQRQALELLKEIAKSLAQPPDEKSQQQQDPEQGEQEQQQDPQQGEQNQQQPSPSSQDPTRSPREQALSTLRRARERERQHRDLRKQLQRAAARRVPVDRDW